MKTGWVKKAGITPLVVILAILLAVFAPQNLPSASDNQDYYENIPKHLLQVPIQTTRAEKTLWWPPTGSNRMDDWPPGKSSFLFGPSAEDKRLTRDNEWSEWVDAIGIGLLSLLAGWALLTVSGVRLSWLAVRF